MKAWRFYGFNDMRLDDVPEPVFAPGQVHNPREGGPLPAAGFLRVLLYQFGAPGLGKTANHRHALRP